jgi:hypothetical protein
VEPHGYEGDDYGHHDDANNQGIRHISSLTVVSEWLGVAQGERVPRRGVAPECEAHYIDEGSLDASFRDERIPPPRRLDRRPDMRGGHRRVRTDPDIERGPRGHRRRRLRCVATSHLVRTLVCVVPNRCPFMCHSRTLAQANVLSVAARDERADTGGVATLKVSAPNNLEWVVKRQVLADWMRPVGIGAMAPLQSDSQNARSGFGGEGSSSVSSGWC